MPRTPIYRKFRLAKVIVPAVAAIVSLVMFMPWINSGSPQGGQAIITVHRGTGFRNIVDQLREAGIIRYRWPILFTGSLFSNLHKIKPGRYSAPRGLSSYSLLLYLHTRPQDEVRVMIPNGVEQHKIAAIIAANLDIDSTAFMAATRNRALLSRLGIKANDTEGYLFPGTYNFPWASTPEEVITFLSGQLQAFGRENPVKRAFLKEMSEHQILTLASIVEAETPVDSEKPVIAGVYLNRLRKNMRLQADPTVQYVLAGDGRHLYFKDLFIDSPYNTYLHTGLPPGPICNPGAASIRAVLNPSEHSYLYFVATGNGGHYFAPDFAAHSENIRKYKASLRQSDAGRNSSRALR